MIQIKLWPNPIVAINSSGYQCLLVYSSEISSSMLRSKNSVISHYSLHIDLGMTSHRLYGYPFYNDTLGDIKPYWFLYVIVWWSQVEKSHIPMSLMMYFIDTKTTIHIDP